MKPFLKPWEFDNPVCAEIGHQPFYLDDRDDPETSHLPDNITDYHKAIALCNSCPFQMDCAEWGITKERYGVWGGLTPDERSIIRRKRNIILNEELSRL